MRIRSWTGICFLLLLCAGIHECRAQENGILLGLRSETPMARVLPYYAGGADSLSRTTYRTLLISKHDSSFTVQFEEDDLLIPRPEGFWRVGVKRSVYNNWVEDFVWAAPKGALRTLAGIQPFNGEYCVGHRKQTILYADPSYLSLDQQSAGYCEGAAHPWFFNTLAVVPIDSTTHSGLSISEVLGPAAHEAWQTSAHAFLDHMDEDQRAGYLQEPDEANWGILRETGHWTVIGRLDAAEEVRHGAYTDLSLPLTVPDSLVGYRQHSIARTALQARAPDAVDTFVAPTKDWLVITHPDRLTIHRMEAGTIGPAVKTVPLTSGSKAVLVQWSYSKNLHDWMRAFDQKTQGS